MKKQFRYIRYRICRNIYYADQCPRDCQKNYSDIAKTIASVIAILPILLLAMIVLVKLA
jgi:hypothetical protein